MNIRSPLASLGALSLMLTACGPAPAVSPDAGSGDDAGPTGCNAIASAGEPVPETAGAGAMPTPAGGAIADGTYVLTAWEIYPPGSVDAFQRRETFVFAGNTVESLSQKDAEPEQRRAGTYSTSGTTWSISLSCPVTQTVDLPYTATPTTLQIFEIGPDVAEVHTYTKR